MNASGWLRACCASALLIAGTLAVAGCEGVGIEGEADGLLVDGQSGADIAGGGDMSSLDGTVGLDTPGSDLIDASGGDGHSGCGDGVLDGDETCDDGNSESGDGCDPGCQVEPGWLCDDAGCACDAGYFGPNCAPCGDCGAFGICNDGLDGDGACACQDGYHGDDCRACAEGYAPVDGGPWVDGGSCMPNDACSEAYCSGNGLCVYPDGGPLGCECFVGWEGDACDTDTDECADDTLCGGGVCVEQPPMELAPECLEQQSDDNGDPAAGCASSPDCEAAVCEKDSYCCEENWDQACADQAWMNPACNVPGYMCECPEGWGGMHCEENVDECAGDENPCANDGECIDTEGAYECACVAGWSGLNCEENVDECAGDENPCANDSECIDTDGSYECACVAGWSGANCEENVDECAADENPCQNGGECSDTDGGFDCACAEGWEGADCADNTDECALEEAPCQNGGACSDLTPEALAPECLVAQQDEEGNPLAGCASSDTCTESVCAKDAFCCDFSWDSLCASQAKVDDACNKLGFACECPDGWTGFDCGTDVNECAAEESPCANGAGCQNLEGGFECLCSAGWTGEDCSENLNECELEEAICQNGGLCSDLEPVVDAPECLEPQADADGNLVAGCETSDACTESVCADDPYCCETAWDSLCASDAGSNTACVLPGFSCECPEGWTGNDCSQDVDECVGDENPCSNDGECINNDGGFDCACSPLWTGALCDENVDECAGDESPCANEGVCIDLVPGVTQCQVAAGGVAEPCSDACAQAVNALDDWCGVGGWDSSCADCAAGGVTGFADCTEIGDVCLGDPSLGMICECAVGWTGPMCEQDVNECSFEEPICANGAECVNSDGAYECLCATGFQGVHCEEDVNECADPTLNDCSDNGSCSNDFGSYSCACNDGYDGDGVDCADVNECEPALLSTQSFDEGLMPDSWVVSDSDEEDDVSWYVNEEGVLRFSNSAGDAYPGDVSGSVRTAPTLIPEQGMIHADVALDLGDDSPNYDKFSIRMITCPEDMTWEACQESELAEVVELWNKASYYEALSGEDMVEGDWLTIHLDVSAWAGYAGALVFSFDSVDDLVNATPGVFVDNLELSGPPLAACSDMAECSNTDGAYGCTCIPGWEGDGFQCANIDECDAEESPCGANSTCEDNAGSYECGCLDGYIPDPDAEVGCIDIDECAENTDDCGNHSVCTNTLGGFTCECVAGYGGQDGKACENVNECAEGLAACDDTAICNDQSTNSCGTSVGCDDDGCRAAVAELDDYCADNWDSGCAACAAGGTGIGGLDCGEIAISGVCLGTEPYFCSCADGFTLNDDGASCSDIDECLDAPCVHGACTNEAGSYTCECEPGWEGVNCELNINECLEDGLCNNGSCDDTEPALAYEHCTGNTACDVPECQAAVGALDDWCLDNWDSSCASCAQGGVTEYADCTGMGAPCFDDAKPGYACSCEDGWTGEHCDIDVDECVDSPCQNGAQCENLDGGFECVCVDGWEGELCGQDIDECAAQPCVNGACLNYDGGYLCACDPGWESQNCDVDVDECLDAPCQNGGVCENQPGAYQCACPAGWVGVHCDTDVNECVELAPCVNGACNNVPGAYECSCDPGWTGAQCNDDINECLDAPCANDTKCVNEPGAYTCECKAGSGWTGQNCDENIDECALSLDYCANGSACVDQEAEIDFKLCQGDTCAYAACRDAVTALDNWCADDWDAGCAQCANGEETNYADCTNLGAVCTVYKAGYACDCVDGWEGELCDQDVNECLNNPCLNGGACNNNDGGFTCSCPDGWEGDLCQEDASPELVGSFKVSDGPPWGENPPTYTCLEACALIFGGSASSYQCSTAVGNINNQAWLDGWGMACHVAAEDYKKNNPYDCGSGGCSESAYVMDHGCSQTNYCWK